ncbi:helix-turn-helix domain-containing protein [Brevibacillus humidisoli]|uniref:helix-turn-helix domain-containing protein n=1 Tax=Brevibacillus humidisoli TaxID=2895522 RepID=UPI001E322AB9|nr:helix-turn-helix domain-containing protein [Brevibacillus humidisoli]UFJ41344.1 helix-turn-helix domain-containing protein [Brevibacillus humidisoli]
MQSKSKTLVRVVKRENNFVQIDKTPINDKRLSWKAKGLLVYLLSKPDDWTIMIDDLVKHAKDGRDSVRTGLTELEQNGYLLRYQRRKDKGEFGSMEYHVFELPQTEIPFTVRLEGDDSPVNGNTVNGKSLNGNTVNGKSNPTNNNKTNNYLTNNEFDEDLEIKAGLSPTQLQQNKRIVEEFSHYAESRGLHIDYVRDILQLLHRVDFALTYNTLGEALVKTLDCISKSKVVHVPNFFMSVLQNEVRKGSSKSVS